MEYTASDLLGVSVGFLLFALFAFAPGYTFGWFSNVFDFRRRRLITRLTIAIPLSIGLTPITTYFLWRWSLPLVWIVFGTSAVICAALLIRDSRALRLRLSRSGWLLMAVVAGWLIVATLSLVDLQFGNQLYFPLSSHDLATHAAFAAAIARDGIPPHNPFFFAGQPAPLRYHYFWYIPCALVSRLGGSLVDARLSVIAGILWADLGLFSVIALYLRFLQENGGVHIERRTLIAVSLLGIAGLDIVPVMLADLSGTYLVPAVSWWTDRFAVWDTVMLWSPHTLASLAAGLAGFLLALDTARSEPKRNWILGVAACAMMFASAAGSSIYITGTLALGCSIWLLVTLLKRSWRQAAVLSGAAIVALVLLVPFIHQLMQGAGTAKSATPAAFPFVFSVRRFSLAEILAGNAGPLKLQLFDTLFLPLNYFIQFGFFSVVGCLFVRRAWRHGLRSQAEQCAAALGATTLLFCTFVSSTVIANNDLGLEGPLIVEFFLLIWAAEMWNEGELGFGRPQPGQPSQRRAAPRLVAVTLVLGAMSTCYDLCVQRTFPILSDMYSVQRYDWLSLDHQLGRRTFALRRAYDDLNGIFPASAVIQADPDLSLGNLPAEMYSGRPMVADVGGCGTVFGGSRKFCDEVLLPHLKPLFEDGDPVTLGEAEQTCRDFSISALLFKDTDPVWKDKSSWIWKSPALISNDYVRVIPCGSH